MLGNPVGRRLEPYPTRDFSRNHHFLPFGVPGAVVELIDFSEELVNEPGNLVVANGPYRPGIGYQQRPVPGRRHGRPLGDQSRILLVRKLARQVFGKDRPQVVIGQRSLVKRQKVHPVLFGQLGQGRLWGPGQDDHGRELAAANTLDGLVVVVVRRLDTNLEHFEYDFGADLGLAVLEIEVDFLAAQIVVRLDLVTRQNVEFRVVELCDVLDVLLDARVELWIALFQQG